MIGKKIKFYAADGYAHDGIVLDKILEDNNHKYLVHVLNRSSDEKNVCIIYPSKIRRIYQWKGFEEI